MLMNKWVGVLAVLGGSVLMTSGAAAAIIVNDTFTDGGFTDGADALDVAWTPTTGTLSVATDTIIGTGNALAFTSTSTFPISRAPFSPTSLNNVGDSITLSFDMRFTAAPGSNVGGFRWALADSTASKSYVFQYGTGGTNGINYVYFPAVAIGGSNGTGITASGTSGNINDQEKHTLSLTITRLANGVSLLSKVDGAGNHSATHTAASAFTSFDTLLIGEGSINTNWRVDNVVVETVPEPTGLALLGVVGGLLAARRRRRML